MLRTDSPAQNTPDRTLLDERSTREAFDAVMAQARAEFARRGELDAFARGSYCGRINAISTYGRGIRDAEFNAASDEIIAMRERVPA